MKYLLLSILGLFLSSCTRSTTGSTSPAVSGAGEYWLQAESPKERPEVCLLPRSMAPGPPRPVRFAVGTFAVDPSHDALLEDWARYILTNPEKFYSIEGHTDDTGGNEYNLTLGQLRAIAVYRRLIELKVPSEQLRIISFGEELPVNPAHTEAARSENRRVHLWEK